MSFDHSALAVDELVKKARGAVARNEMSLAVSFLKRASAAAPLRRDIRQMLADVLSGGGIDDAPSFGDGGHETSPEDTNANNDYVGRMAEPSRATGFLRSATRKLLQRSPRVVTEYQADEPSEVSEEAEEISNGYQDYAQSRLLAAQAFERARQRNREHAEAHSAPAAPRSARRAAQVVEENHALPAPRPRRESRMFAAQSVSEQPAERQAPLPRSERRAAPQHAEKHSDNHSIWSMLAHAIMPLKSQMVVYAGISFFIATACMYSYMKYYTRNGGGGLVAQMTVQNGAARATNQLSETDEAILRLADSYLSTKRVDDAIALLNDTRNRAPQSALAEKAGEKLAAAYLQRGTAMLTSNRLKEAVAEYQKASELAPDSHEVALNLGNAYYYCGLLLEAKNAADNYQKSISSLNRAIELDRSNVQAYHKLATVYENLKNTPEARNAYGKIIELAPTSNEARKATAKLQTMNLDGRR